MPYCQAASALGGPMLELLQKHSRIDAKGVDPVPLTEPSIWLIFQNPLVTDCDGEWTDEVGV